MTGSFSEAVSSLLTIADVASLPRDNPRLFILGNSTDKLYVLVSKEEPPESLARKDGLWVVAAPGYYYGRVLKQVGVDGRAFPGDPILYNSVINTEGFKHLWVEVFSF